MFTKRQKNIVVIGGGTGTYTVLSGLKKYPPDLFDLTAIVTVADSGGSTGRLRDEFGYLPVGDFRMALVALADDSEVGNALRSLFLHRFDKGEGLKGHNFGNLFLVALTDIFGSEERAIEYASQMLRVRGRVLPVTSEKITLAAEYESGHTVKGETYIDEPPESHDGTQKIKRLWIEPEARISERAREAIASADLIIMGPGDLYTSILASVVVPGTKEALVSSKGKLLFVLNLMSKYGQTHNFTANDHLTELIQYTGRNPDYVLVNNNNLPEDILEAYYAQKEFPIADDLEEGSAAIIRNDFLASEEVKKKSGDTLRRSLIRHDPDKLARAIIEIM
ncbi:MAG: YvcK family protein [Parcubacteria group bacterium]|nr:YvcK family protein [Parcubacteria group bacterium]